MGWAEVEACSAAMAATEAQCAPQRTRPPSVPRLASRSTSTGTIRVVTTAPGSVQVQVLALVRVWEVQGL